MYSSPTPMTAGSFVKIPTSAAGAMCDRIANNNMTAAAINDASLNVLHICGDQIYFDAGADYPVHAISWNSEAPGNPGFGAAAGMTRAAVMGGVAEDTTLLTGTAADVERSVVSALAETGGRRTLVAAGCSVGPATPSENLFALRGAARSWQA